MNFVTFQSDAYIEYVDTGALCDEVLLQINQIKSRAPLQIKKSRYFERLTKYDRFKYLLKQLDESNLLNIVRQVVPQTLTSYHERILCVCVGTPAHARMHACVFVCMRICVYVCVYTCAYDCMCVCVRECILFFIIYKDALHSQSEQYDRILSLKIYLLSSTRDVLGNATIIIQLKTYKYYIV